MAIRTHFIGSEKYREWTTVEVEIPDEPPEVPSEEYFALIREYHVRIKRDGYESANLWWTAQHPVWP